MLPRCPGTVSETRALLLITFYKHTVSCSHLYILYGDMEKRPSRVTVPFAGARTADGNCHGCGLPIHAVDLLATDLAFHPICAFTDADSGVTMVFHSNCARIQLGEDASIVRDLYPTNTPCVCGVRLHERIGPKPTSMVLWCDYRTSKADFFHMECAAKLVLGGESIEDRRVVDVAPFAAKFAGKVRVYLPGKGVGGGILSGIPMQSVLEFVRDGVELDEDIKEFTDMLQVEGNAAGVMARRTLKTRDARLEHGGTATRTRRMYGKDLEEWVVSSHPVVVSDPPRETYPFACFCSKNRISIGLVLRNQEYDAPSIWSHQVVREMLFR